MAALVWVGIQAKASGAGAPTFNRDVAPIMYAQCAGCHRPEQSGPFDLLTYADVRKRADQILEVVNRRLMPPWPPEPGYARFANERVLTPEQRETLRRWVAEGAVEGAAGGFAADAAVADRLAIGAAGIWW